MAVASAIKEGATTVAATGGTDVTLVSLGIQGNKNTLAFSTDTSLATRRYAEFSVKAPVANPASITGYTQARCTVLVKFPKSVTDVGIVTNTAKFELSYDINTTTAEVETYLEQISQLIGTSAFMAFYKDLNLN